MFQNKKDNWLAKFREISRDYSDTSILMHQAIAQKAGLSGTDHKYLGLIINHKAMTAGEIAQVTGLTTGAVTGLIDRLEQKALVFRKPDQHDRRKVVIIPNMEKTRALLVPIFSDLQEKTKNLIATFSEDEVKVIEKYFVSATEIMKTVTQDLKNAEK